MGPDPAGFRDADVQAGYGSDPSCLLNGTRIHLEKHHILGRDGDMGIRPDDPRRELLSSVFNCAVVEHSFHAGGLRDHQYARMLLLDAVHKMIDRAILRGDYSLTDIDRGFFDLVIEWHVRHGL